LKYLASLPLYIQDKENKLSLGYATSPRARAESAKLPEPAKPRPESAKRVVTTTVIPTKLAASPYGDAVNKRPLSAGSVADKAPGTKKTVAGFSGKPNAARPKNVDNMVDILQTIQQLQEQSDLRVKDYDKLKVRTRE
jgi:hypothetical protein